jgi:hypothetical protein
MEDLPMFNRREFLKSVAGRCRVRARLHRQHGAQQNNKDTILVVLNVVSNGSLNTVIPIKIGLLQEPPDARRTQGVNVS